LARAVGGIAMGGIWYKPHLVKTTKPDPPHVLALNQENVDKVISGMCGVVNESGTGLRAKIPGYEICGKTGSAQLASNEFIKKGGKAPKDNAWFVGFWPPHNPEVVVAALYEGGEHGQLAAPLARDVIKSYLDKKVRLGKSAMLASKAGAGARVPVVPQNPPPATDSTEPGSADVAGSTRPRAATSGGSEQP